ncbi:MAG: tRNA (adenosine(37)-N6)-threonylcarbamoyltransferase complex dimerization subunit type 1 TsaB [Bacteroidia bacterium]
MSLILCIESSYSICSVAILKEGKLFVTRGQEIQNHSESIIKLIEECLSAASIKLKDLNAIALSDGPGSYTGLRIGASTAKGFCLALNIPLIKLSTLKSLAWSYMQSNPNYLGLIWPMIDARRMEVYHAIFNHKLHVIRDVSNGIITEPSFIPGHIEDQDIVICGDGAMKAGDVLGLPVSDIIPDARNLCNLAEECFNRNEFVDIANYEPFYLKSANITSKKTSS